MQTKLRREELPDSWEFTDNSFTTLVFFSKVCYTTHISNWWLEFEDFDVRSHTFFDGGWQ